MKDETKIAGSLETGMARLLGKMSPERRLAGLTLEQRLAGLTPEQVLRALSPYLATLPEEAKQVLRVRLEAAAAPPAPARRRKRQ